MAGAAKVEIYGQEYTIAGREDPTEMASLAAHVDSKMREIAANTVTVDTVKVAILAAVHIAHEYYQCRRELDALKQEVDQKAGSLESALKKAIEAS